MEASKNRYLLTGGGTGGHVYPAIAIADELRRREPQSEFLYVGVKGKAEEAIVPKRGYPLEFMTSRGWPGARPSLSLLAFAWSLGWGICKALRILFRFRPTVIIATGGYVSAPILFAWILLKRLRLTESRAFVHEQNLAPGRLNRLVGKLANRVGVSFERSLPFFDNGEFLGYPVRQEVGRFSKQEARDELQIPLDAKVVLVFGGSQGARTINRAMVDALPFLLQHKNLWVIHGVGRYQGEGYRAEQDTRSRFEALSLFEEQNKRYQMHAYLDPIDMYYAAADLVICRAGAGTLAEIAICSLPALIIPKANLPGDHQVMNARAIGDVGAAKVLYESVKLEKEGLIEFVDGQTLAEDIWACLADEALLKQMSLQVKAFADGLALGKITDRVQQLAQHALPALPPRNRVQDSPHKGLLLSSLGGADLVSYIGRHGRASLTEEDLEYLAYRTDGYLASLDWQTRNIGVKLVGLLKLTHRLDSVLFILGDRTPASTLHRWLGGDFRQVGFIRRNAIKVLEELGVWNEQVKTALLRGLEDPYYEVRSWSADTLKFFAPSLVGDSEILSALRKRLSEKNFEVVCSAIAAFAELETQREACLSLRAFYLHPNWKIRATVVKAWTRFLQRGVLSAEEIQHDLKNLLLTSSGFSPRFQIREQMVVLSNLLQSAPAQEDPKQNG